MFNMNLSMSNIFAVLVCVGALNLSVFSVHAQTVKPTLAKVAEAGTIRVAYRESAVPFSYLDNGKPTGFSFEMCMRIVDAVKAKLQRPDLKTELVPVTSQNRIPFIQDGTVDVECGVTTNNATRGEQVQFSINHFYTGTRLLTKKTSGVKSYADLKGKTASTTAGTTNVVVLRKYFRDNNLEVNLINAKSDPEAFGMVEIDQSVAYAMDDILLYGFAANAKKPSEWTVVGDALQVEPYAFMLRKNDPEFKKLVDDTIATAMKNGDFEKLYKKWFLSPVPPNGINMNVPMSDELKANLKALSDKPAM
jgi:ABC-type amino acid transport substrate-binding protein